SIAIMADACRSFELRCARGIEPNRARIEEHWNNSLMLATALAQHIGYGKAAQISLAAHREGTSLRVAALSLGLVTAEQFDEWIRPEEMTRPRAGR
ncbi:MAG: class II fumarate hydratase, partial [Bryobacteraceae bacterium]